MRQFISKRAILRFIAESMEILACSLALIFTDATTKSLISGGIVAFLGAGLFTWAGGFARMEREGRLTLGGPYRFVRHPWILARFLMVFGVILMSRQPLLFLGTMAALAPVYRQMTRNEDQWMDIQLGPTAAEYRALVSGFVPQFVPVKLPMSWRSMDQERFSWSRALLRRPGRGWLAYAGLVGAVVAMMVWVSNAMSVVWWRAVAAVAVSAAIIWLVRDRENHPV
jgi:protein-S-isoprenylcysteine O-methyltransferase Ste14